MPLLTRAWKTQHTRPILGHLPFLHLAITGKADALVSGDKALLALAGTRGLCPVLSVEAFCRQLAVAAA
jgi:predicted nucleic acid-binding protein